MINNNSADIDLLDPSLSLEEFREMASKELSDISRLEKKLKSIERDLVRAQEDKARAVADGDLSENYDNTVAEAKIASLQEQKNQVTQSLKQTVTLTENYRSTGKVQMECAVDVDINNESFRFFVSPVVLSDIRVGFLSQNAPILIQLYGRRTGDTFTYNNNNYKIKGVY